jgi:hypothetical protein
VVICHLRFEIWSLGFGHWDFPNLTDYAARTIPPETPVTAVRLGLRAW